MLVPPSRIPDFDALTVAGEGGEALAKSVDEFADAEIEPFEEIGPAAPRPFA